MRRDCPRGRSGGPYVGMRPLYTNWHRLRQYIARKPHSTGIKLYVLCDNTYGYVFDVYLYTGRRGRIRRTSTCARNLDAKGIMRCWALQVPPETRLGGGLVLRQPWPCGVLRVHQPAVLDIVKTQQEGRGLDGREATARRGASGTWCDHGPRLRIGGF